MTSEKQLELWLKGKSVHIQDLCTPDFSCCKPELLAPLHERKAFIEADRSGNEEVKMSMLGLFLSRALACASTKKIHIIGHEEKEPSKESH